MMLSAPLHTISQAADRLGVSSSTVRRLIESGQLKVCRFSERIVRIAPEALAEFIERSTGGEAATQAQPLPDAPSRPNVAALVVSLKGA